MRLPNGTIVSEETFVYMVDTEYAKIGIDTKEMRDTLNPAYWVMEEVYRITMKIEIMGDC